MTADQYCRDIEAHLCRRNGGHLIRLVGPAFELVQTWYRTGIPFKVACQGIDRHVDRVAARGPRRRPVRLEFCEPDVLDAFDAWRRAVGVKTSDLVPEEPGAESAGEAAEPRGPSLPTHIDRVIARLTALRAGPAPAPPWSGALEDAARRLDALRVPAKRARGETRAEILAELEAIDRALMEAAVALAPDEARAGAASEAEEELTPFRGRLSEADYAAAVARASQRALRARLGLPAITRD